VTVLVLMYHRTPQATDQVYDVSLQTFKDHVGAMRDAGIAFVPFASLRSPAKAAKRQVCITFDDGDASNMEALLHLHDLGIASTEFVVSEWSKASPDHLSAKMLAELPPLCAVASHCATHRAMTTLSADEATWELTASRDYLEQATGRQVREMAFPGGDMNSAVVALARKVGYDLLGTSQPYARTNECVLIPRIALKRNQSAADLMALIDACDAYWARERLMDNARATVTKLVGRGAYAALVTPIKRALRGAH
jgi:peptidoglycan/xylan/chitin deacetylase (PgdA/CDA1 family)